MPYLTIAGTEYFVLADAARELEPQIAAGESVRSFSGRALSTARGQIRAWQVTLYDLDVEEWHALRDATPPGRVVQCGGEILDLPTTEAGHLVTREGRHEWHAGRTTRRHTVSVTLTITRAEPE